MDIKGNNFTSKKHCYTRWTIFGFPLQGKQPIVEVMENIFSVTTFANIVKKTSATTFVCRIGGFGACYNEYLL